MFADVSKRKDHMEEPKFLDTIPKMLKVQGIVFEILLVKDRNLEHGKQATGSCSTAYQKIWLEYGNRKIDGIKEDLLHEILEALKCECDLDMSHQTLTTLSSMLNQVLRDNRLVFFEEEHATD